MAEIREIRVLSGAEVETLVNWAAAEGWNPGAGDAQAFRAADPDGFLGCFVGGEMVAGISAVAYGTDFGFIGLYICRPDMRGRGHGRAVWDAAMTRLEGRTIGLDGVPAQQANYRSMGFVDAYRTFRFSGRFEGGAKGRATPVGPADFLAVANLDARHFPSARPQFLKAWLAPPRIALAVVAGGRVLGYGAARACREGYKIGPLFAREEAVATDLLAALAGRCDGEIHIDAPETNGPFVARLEAAGLTRGFETARMYRGPAPAVDLSGIFGVTTLELG